MRPLAYLLMGRARALLTTSSPKPSGARLSLRLASPLLALALMVCATSAHAQYVTMREYERMLDHAKVAATLDTNMFFGHALKGEASAGYSFIQPTAMFAARYKEAVFEAAVPFAYFHQNNQPGADQNRVIIGNPWLGLAYLPDCTCGLSRLSLGMSIDAAQSDSPLERAGLQLARGALGDWDGFLWIDKLLPVVAGASTRMDLGMVRLSWDGDLIFGLPARTRDFNFGMQHAGELAVLFNWHLQIAGRASLAWYPTFPGDDFQSALSFYFRYVVVTDSFGVRFTFNLDGPRGWSFDPAGVWGAGIFYSTRL